MNWWMFGVGQMAAVLALCNLYRIAKNQEREIAVLRAENALLREWRDQACQKNK